MAKRNKGDNSELILSLMKTAFCDGFMAARDLVTLGKATSDENMNKMWDFYLKRITDKLAEKGANSMSEQLKLTKKQLLQIGFERKVSKADKLNPSRVFYTIDCLNGYFYYNPNEKVYSWYLRTLNHDTHLYITSAMQLYIVLMSFKVKYNTVIF